MLNHADITHLLQRTEFVARPQRVAALVAKPSLAAAVDDILAVPTSPTMLTYSGTLDSQRVVEVTDSWFDKMAHDAPRPVQEKVALFWHGHFCSSNAKVGSIELMRQQIDLFRSDGLGNFRDLGIAMSTQVAMLRYLDNNQNVAWSRNENFGRELMELFVLGVGNYTELDVQACAAAWTGHTDDYATETYRWVPGYHDNEAKTLLGVSINDGGDPQLHGAETIETMLGAGVVPAGASNVSNRGRPTREVAAEFLSVKLWKFFAGSSPSPALVAELSQVAIAHDFEIKPWLRAILLHPAFFTPAARQGLVRPPIDYMVTLLVASGLRSNAGTPWWLLEGMGQRPLFPPDVSGWKDNAYWVNASAFGLRASAARHVSFYLLNTYWDGDGMIRLPVDTITIEEVEATAASPSGRRHIVTRILNGMRLTVGVDTRSSLDEFATNAAWHELSDLITLILLAPEMNLA